MTGPMDQKEKLFHATDLFQCLGLKGGLLVVHGSEISTYGNAR